MQNLTWDSALKAQLLATYQGERSRLYLHSYINLASYGLNPQSGISKKGQSSVGCLKSPAVCRDKIRDLFVFAIEENLKRTVSSNVTTQALFKRRHIYTHPSSNT